MLGSREFEGFLGQIEENRSICSWQKVENRRDLDKLAEGLIPREFEETLSLQSGVGSVITKRWKKFNLTALPSWSLNVLCYFSRFTPSEVVRTVNIPTPLAFMSQLPRFFSYWTNLFRVADFLSIVYCCKIWNNLSIILINSNPYICNLSLTCKIKYTVYKERFTIKHDILY